MTEAQNKKRIQQYQKSCFKDYKSSINYPEKYEYFYGNPINVLVPVETEINKAMIVGAYPSAKFFTIKGKTNVPIASNDSPFSDELYFDGSRARSIPSGKELNEVILQRIGLKREDCWITNMVKVFLFKDGHIDKYKALDKKSMEENRSKYMEYAEKSMEWLEKEIKICQPSVIILLGMEVIKTVFDLSDKKAKGYMDGSIKTKEIDGEIRNVICLPHPGILMRRQTNNPWPEKFEKEISVRAKKEIAKLKKDWR
jgi:uracil-DNA glycosylase